MSSNDTESCPSCGGERHDAALKSRYADCVTCGGRIHHYPPPSSTIFTPGGAWVHLNMSDWRDNPHMAQPPASGA